MINFCHPVEDPKMLGIQTAFSGTSGTLNGSGKEKNKTGIYLLKNTILSGTEKEVKELSISLIEISVCLNGCVFKNMLESWYL